MANGLGTRIQKTQERQEQAEQTEQKIVKRLGELRETEKKLEKQQQKAKQERLEREGPRRITPGGTPIEKRLKEVREARQSLSQSLEQVQSQKQQLESAEQKLKSARQRRKRKRREATIEQLQKKIEEAERGLTETVLFKTIQRVKEGVPVDEALERAERDVGQFIEQNDIDVQTDVEDLPLSQKVDIAQSDPDIEFGVTDKGGSALFVEKDVKELLSDAQEEEFGDRVDLDKEKRVKLSKLDDGVNIEVDRDLKGGFTPVPGEGGFTPTRPQFDDRDIDLEGGATPVPDVAVGGFSPLPGRRPRIEGSVPEIEQDVDVPEREIREFADLEVRPDARPTTGADVPTVRDVEPAFDPEAAVERGGQVVRQRLQETGPIQRVVEIGAGPAIRAGRITGIEEQAAQRAGVEALRQGQILSEQGGQQIRETGAAETAADIIGTPTPIEEIGLEVAGVGEEVEQVGEAGLRGLGRGVATAGTQATGFFTAGFGGAQTLGQEFEEQPVETAEEFATESVPAFGTVLGREVGEDPLGFVSEETGEEVSEAAVGALLLGPAGAAAGTVPETEPEPTLETRPTPQQDSGGPGRLRREPEEELPGPEELPEGITGQTIQEGTGEIPRIDQPALARPGQGTRVFGQPRGAPGTQTEVLVEENIEQGLTKSEEQVLRQRAEQRGLEFEVTERTAQGRAKNIEFRGQVEREVEPGLRQQILEEIREFEFGETRRGTVSPTLETVEPELEPETDLEPETRLERVEQEIEVIGEREVTGVERPAEVETPAEIQTPEFVAVPEFEQDLTPVERQIPREGLEEDVVPIEIQRERQQVEQRIRQGFEEPQIGLEPEPQPQPEVDRTREPVVEPTPEFEPQPEPQPEPTLLPETETKFEEDQGLFGFESERQAEFRPSLSGIVLDVEPEQSLEELEKETFTGLETRGVPEELESEFEF